MRNYLAVWTWTLPSGRRQEITMSYWANTMPDARHIAGVWFNRLDPTTEPADFTLTDLSAERIP